MFSRQFVSAVQLVTSAVIPESFHIPVKLALTTWLAVIQTAKFVLQATLAPIETCYHKFVLLVATLLWESPTVSFVQLDHRVHRMEASPSSAYLGNLVKKEVKELLFTCNCKCDARLHIWKTKSVGVHYLLPIILTLWETKSALIFPLYYTSNV